MQANVSENKSKVDYWRKKLGVPLAILVPLLIIIAGKPAGLSAAGHMALALFSGTFVLYLTEAIPLPITGLAIIPASVLMGITNIKGAMSGFGASSVYLMLGAFILAAAMVKSRFAERITYHIMNIVGDSAKSILIGVTLANIILAFLVPSTTARTAILLPVCLSIIQVYGVEGSSNFAKGLLLVLTFTNSTIAAGILTASVPNPITVSFIAKAGGDAISYLDWFVYGFPPALLMTIITCYYVHRVYKPEVESIPNGKEFVKEKLAELGPVSPNEKRAILVFTLVVFLWITGQWTNLDTTVACLAGTTLLFLPGLGFLTWSDAGKSISWNVLMLTGGGLTLGELLVTTGAAKWLAVTIFHSLGLGELSVVAVLIIVMLIVQYLHIVFVATTPMATGLIPIIISIAEVVNLNPAVLALPAGMIIAGYPLLMFYNTSPNILVYGTNQLSVGDFPRVGFALCGIACVVYAICAMTYWRWLGLF